MESDRLNSLTTIETKYVEFYVLEKEGIDALEESLEGIESMEDDSREVISPLVMLEWLHAMKINEGYDGLTVTDNTLQDCLNKWLDFSDKLFEEKSKRPHMKPWVEIYGSDSQDSRFDELRLPEKIVSAIDNNPFNTKNISLFSFSSLFSN